jgi:hypothetical protein
MDNDTFRYYHRLIADFEKISRSFIENFTEDYNTTLSAFPIYTYCSEDCKNKCTLSSENFHHIRRIEKVMIIDHLYLICGHCQKKIESGDEFYYINNEDEILDSNSYDTIFLKTLLIALFANIIHRFYTFGILYKNDEFTEYSVVWINIILKHLISYIPVGEVFYRAKKKLFSKSDTVDFKEKSLMRFPDLEYTRDNRFTRGGLLNLYLAEDMETCKK